MLTLAIRKSVSRNLQQIAACVSCRSKARTKIVQYSNESDPLFTLQVNKLPNFVACKLYSTETDSKPQIILPMLVDGAPTQDPSFLSILKLKYVTNFQIIPFIDDQFCSDEFVKGAKQAMIVISKALANKNYEALQDLVTEDMIEILKTKIETLNPNQRQLIAVTEDDIIGFAISDITTTIGDESFIDITVSCIYMQDFDKKKPGIWNTIFSEFVKGTKCVQCNYIFTRKYVNKVENPWIVTFVNHYTVSFLK